MFFVYVLISKKDQNFYIGFTDNVERRFKEHTDGSVESTKHRRPLMLIYYEAYLDKRDAQGREKFLKSGSGHKYLNKQLRYFLEASSDTLCKISRGGGRGPWNSKGFAARALRNALEEYSCCDVNEQLG
ncbi:MAG: GIY-YIG nuclease family protein [Candidatus Omnitrophica bacterium]|nr:GIY-YIG nuclease family protein [Candidatus Omnitrophota bacterium]